MNQVIRPEVSYLEKSWNSIFNQSYIKEKNSII
jgi:hypothetical protein